VNGLPDSVAVVCGRRNLTVVQPFSSSEPKEEGKRRALFPKILRTQTTNNLLLKQFESFEPPNRILNNKNKLAMRKEKDKRESEPVC
jgi:hypothetical protein